MIKCQNQGGCYQWEAVPTEEDITTIHTQLWGDATGLFLWTYISQVVLQLQRLYSMAFSSFRRRSIGARTFSGGGQGELLLLLPFLFYIISYNNNNHHFLFFQCMFRGSFSNLIIFASLTWYSHVAVTAVRIVFNVDSSFVHRFKNYQFETIIVTWCLLWFMNDLMIHIPCLIKVNKLKLHVRKRCKKI